MVGFILLGLGISIGLAQLSISQTNDEPELSAVRLEYEVRKKLASEGDPDAKLQVFLHVRDSSPELDDQLSEALGDLTESARLGNVDAQLLLGRYLVQGEYVDADLTGGIAMLNQAASTGDFRAMFWLGDAYYQLLRVSDTSTEKDAAFTEAEHLWAKLIESSDVPKDISLAAQDRLGLMYVRASFLDDRGWQLLFDAADQGYDPALRSLTEMRETFVQLKEQGYSQAIPILNRLDKYFDRKGLDDQDESSF